MISFLILWGYLVLNKIKWLYEKPLTKRVIATLLSLIFFSFMPMIVATCYMAWEGFFSYDLFEKGGVGIDAFYIYTEIIVVVVSLYLSGAYSVYQYNIIKYKNADLNEVSEKLTCLSLGGSKLLTISIVDQVAAKDKNPIYCWNFKFALALNIFVSLFFVFGLLNGRSGFELLHLVLIFIVSLWICRHVVLVLVADGRKILNSLLVGIAIIVSIAVFQPGTFAFPYSLALQLFGVGGGLPVNVKADGISYIGKLIISTPDFVYISKGNELNIVDRSKISSFKIKNVSGFGHGKKPECKVAWLFCK